MGPLRVESPHMTDTDSSISRRAPSSEASGDSPAVEAVESLRMSFGDHLDELRGCLIRSLLGLAVGAGLALLFGKSILLVVFAPLLAAQHAQGIPVELQALAPTAAFNAYLKIAILAGLILSMPWVLHQIWGFVAAGLYENERRFVRALAPASMGLFAVGVVFLYFIVLPIVLNFFIAFNKSFDVPVMNSSALQRIITGVGEAPPLVETNPGEGSPTTPIALPQVNGDPPAPQPGSAWIDLNSRRLKFQTSQGILSIPMQLGSSGSAVQSLFAIDAYISFVLTLALAFGISFQMPIVVYFLARLGIVPTATMQKSRRYVIFGIFFVAAVLTPPDVLSQTLLGLPMWGLFELGLFLARRAEARARAAAG
jgi:Tat protein translocase TatC